MLDRLERATPAADAREGLSRRRPRPALEHHRLPGRDPAPAAGRDPAPLGADVGSHRDEIVVALEGFGEAEVIPHLGEPRVDVHVDTARRRRQQIFVVEEPVEVEQQLGAGEAGERVAARDADRLRAAAEQQAVVVVQPGRVPSSRPANGRRREDLAPAARFAGVDHARVEAVEEENLEPEPPEPEQVAEKDPGVPGASGPLRDRAGDRHGRHQLALASRSPAGSRSVA